MAKVGDFGLARNVHKYEEYVKTSAVSDMSAVAGNVPLVFIIFVSTF